MGTEENPGDISNFGLETARIASSLENIADNLSRPQALSKAEQSKFVFDIISAFGLWAAAAVALWAIFASGKDADAQRNQMERQRIAMQGQLDELRLEQRPWISLKVEKGDLGISRPGSINSFLNQHLYFDGNLTLKLGNHGRTPATRIAAAAEFFPSDEFVNPNTFSQKLRRQALRVCNEMASSNRVNGSVVFQGEQDTRLDILAMAEKKDFPTRRNISRAALTVCVKYGAGDHGPVYETARTWGVSGIDFAEPTGRRDNFFTYVEPDGDFAN